MGLKNKILLILIFASIVSAGLTGVALVSLMKLHGQLAVDGHSDPLITGLAIAVYLLGVFIMLGLLNFLLGKSIIMPVVEKEVLETERNLLAEQLQHSQKLEAVGRLAGSIAHDFNNLLTIIDGYACLIMASPDSKDVARHAREVVDASRKATSITRKLLSFGQSEQAEAFVLDLNTVMADADKLLSRTLGEKTRLLTRLSSSPVYVKTNPVLLGQILMNLTINAREAMPNGGRITILTSQQVVNDGECRKPDNLPAGEYACITVRDVGQGIDAGIIDRIFEPFFSTKPEGKGAGLGLSIVKDIVKKHKGFIDLESKPGEGASFHIYLPLADAASIQELENTLPKPVRRRGKRTTAKKAAPKKTTTKKVTAKKTVAKKAPAKKAATKAPARRAPTKKEATILLVEDDPMIRTLVSHTLEGQNYKVLLADDGWQAIQIARKHAKKIDLLFTDVVMPGLGGGALALAMREIHPEIKALFMSGYSRAQVMEEEGIPPDSALLEKPFTPDQAVSIVRDLLAE